METPGFFFQKTHRSSVIGQETPGNSVHTEKSITFTIISNSANNVMRSRITSKCLLTVHILSLCLVILTEIQKYLIG